MDLRSTFNSTTFGPLIFHGIGLCPRIFTNFRKSFSCFACPELSTNLSHECAAISFLVWTKDLPRFLEARALRATYLGFDQIVAKTLSGGLALVFRLLQVE